MMDSVMQLPNDRFRELYEVESVTDDEEVINPEETDDANFPSSVPYYPQVPSSIWLQNESNIIDGVRQQFAIGCPSDPTSHDLTDDVLDEDNCDDDVCNTIDNNDVVECLDEDELLDEEEEFDEDEQIDDDEIDETDEDSVGDECEEYDENDSEYEELVQEDSEEENLCDAETAVEDAVVLGDTEKDPLENEMENVTFDMNGVDQGNMVADIDQNCEQKITKPKVKRKRKNPGNKEPGSTNVEGRRVKSKKRQEGAADVQGPKLGQRKKKRRKRKHEETSDTNTLKVRKSVFERRNIRKIIEEDVLDEATKAAQKEEMERRQRLQEIQEQYRLQQQALDLRMASGQIKLPFGSTEHGRYDIDYVQDKYVDMPMDSLPLNHSSHTSSYPLPQAVTRQPSTSSEKFASHPKRPSFNDDVVEISSSDDEETEVVCTGTRFDDADDDGQHGTHIDDRFNKPDEFGRVLVNVGHHPTDERDVFLAQKLADKIKPHQIGGVRFLYENVVQSLSHCGAADGLGCILAHSMGLGKTLQAISFIEVFLRCTGAHSVLVIVPVNTLQNWVSEFNYWLPQYPADGSKLPSVNGDNSESMNNGGCSDGEACTFRRFRLHVVNEVMKTNAARAKVVGDWRNSGGVLLLGYEMYRLLTTKKVVAKPRRYGRKNIAEDLIIDVDEEDSNRKLLRGLQEALIDPGPDLVICDEGHRIKNCHASISRALKNIRTRRRVVLTGYPLQNNLMEYWCMVDFVRPNYLGTKNEFSNMFERPIMNGQCNDSTPEDIRVMRYRSHVLHKLLEGFVQRRSHNVLKTSLPEKEEYVFLIRMSPIQRRLYTEFMNTLKDSGLGSTNPIKAFSVCCKIWNHPDILYQVVEQRKDDNDLDIEDSRAVDISSSGNSADNVEICVPKRGRGRPPRLFRTASGASFQDGMFGLGDNKKETTISYDWATEIMSNYEAGVIENSGKMVILLDIISQAVTCSEKVLVFSQSLFTLNLIEEYLNKQTVPNGNCTWAKNRNYFRLDGSTSSIERERLVNLFNAKDNDKIHLFLLSTRAGCLGINLIGASRVVIFDASWNPCHDCQAVCRVYRYGQARRCFIYRLVSDNTMESKIYNRQISKQGISDRIVDEMNPQNLLERRQIDVLMQYVDIESPLIDPSNCEKYSDSVLANVTRNHYQWITKLPFTHESLLLDQKETKLTRYEKQLAEQSYQRDKMMGGRSRPYSPPEPSKYESSQPSPLMGMEIGNPGAYMHPAMQNAIQPISPPPADDLQHRLSHQVEIRPGVFIQQIQTTRDITVPNHDSPWDMTSNKISAGEKILVIKTPKGTYIRTREGKIYAVNAGMHSTNDYMMTPGISASSGNSYVPDGSLLQAAGQNPVFSYVPSMPMSTTSNSWQGYHAAQYDLQRMLSHTSDHLPVAGNAAHTADGSLLAASMNYSVQNVSQGVHSFLPQNDYSQSLMDDSTSSSLLPDSGLGSFDGFQTANDLNGLDTTDLADFGDVDPSDFSVNNDAFCQQNSDDILDGLYGANNTNVTLSPDVERIDSGSHFSRTDSQMSRYSVSDASPVSGTLGLPTQSWLHKDAAQMNGKHLAITDYENIDTPPENPSYSKDSSAVDKAYSVSADNDSGEFSVPFGDAEFDWMQDITG